jgi:hypothetical protein
MKILCSRLRVLFLKEKLSIRIYKRFLFFIFLFSRIFNRLSFSRNSTE